MTHDRIPVCHRCRLHPGLIGVYSLELKSDQQVCVGCLSPDEKRQIDEARAKQAAEPSLFDQQFGEKGPWRDQG